MKKIMSLVLTLVLVFTLTATSFAATSGPSYTVLSGVVDDYTDKKTGLSFSVPEEWTVDFSSVKRGATGNGSSYFSRNITIATGKGLVTIQQAGRNAMFVITVTESNDVYYLDDKGLIDLDGYNYLPSSEETGDWANYQRAINAVIASLSLTVQK